MGKATPGTAGPTSVLGVHGSGVLPGIERLSPQSVSVGREELRELAALAAEAAASPSSSVSIRSSTEPSSSMRSQERWRRQGRSPWTS